MCMARLDHYHHVSEAELSVARPMNTNAVAHSDTSTDEQKKDWFLRLNPNGMTNLLHSLSLHRELTLIRSHSCNQGQYPVACVSIVETSAQLLYLFNTCDKESRFGFTDLLEQSEALQWLYFWHGSGAPYQGNLGFFRGAQEKTPISLLHTHPSFALCDIKLIVLIPSYSTSRHQ
jgi:hypothetical protein